MRGLGSRAARCWLLLAAACGLSFFWRLGANGIWDLDEALYVESAREMRLTGDYVTPRVNGQPFFEKPPLIYWEAAGFYALFGRSELTARLPSAVASTLLVALIFVAGSRLFGRRTGLIAALFFALCPLALGSGRQLTTDATLDLCITAALFSFYFARAPRATDDERWRTDDQRPTAGVEPRRSEEAKASRCGTASEAAAAAVGVPDPEYPIPNTQYPAPTIEYRTPYVLSFWLFCGLGVLCKGLPGLLIPGGVAFLYIAAVSRWRWREMGEGVRAMRPVLGVALLFLVAAPWHVLAWRQSGYAFYHEYVVRQHLQRFQGGDTAHHAPVWFYVPALLVGLFPLSVALPAAALDRSGDAASAATGRPRLFLKVWSAAVFLLFTAMGSKLFSYILPMYAPAALLAADWCVRRVEQGRIAPLRWCALTAACMSGALLGVVLARDPILHAAAAIAHRPVRLDQVPPGAFDWAAHLLAAVTLGCVAAAALLALRRPGGAFAALAVGMAGFAAIGIGEGLPLLDRALLRPLDVAAAEAGRATLADRTTGQPSRLAVFVGPPRRPSVLFYLPDDLLRRDSRAGGHTRVIEVMQRGNGEGQLASMLMQRTADVVLTDRERADRLLGSNPRLTGAGDGAWVVLTAAPHVAKK